MSKNHKIFIVFPEFAPSRVKISLDILFYKASGAIRVALYLARSLQISLCRLKHPLDRLVSQFKIELRLWRVFIYAIKAVKDVWNHQKLGTDAVCEQSVRIVDVLVHEKIKLARDHKNLRQAA